MTHSTNKKKEDSREVKIVWEGSEAVDGGDSSPWLTFVWVGLVCVGFDVSVFVLFRFSCSGFYHLVGSKCQNISGAPLKLKVIPDSSVICL